MHPKVEIWEQWKPPSFIIEIALMAVVWTWHRAAMLLPQVESRKLQVASCRRCRLIVVSQRGKRKAAWFGWLVSLSVSLLAAFCGHISAAWLLMSIRLPNSDDMLSIFVSWPLKLLVGWSVVLAGWPVAGVVQQVRLIAGPKRLGKRVNTGQQQQKKIGGDGENRWCHKGARWQWQDCSCSPFDWCALYVNWAVVFAFDALSRDNQQQQQQQEQQQINNRRQRRDNFNIHFYSLQVASCNSLCVAYEIVPHCNELKKYDQNASIIFRTAPQRP